MKSIQDLVENNSKKPVFGSFWYTLLVGYLIFNWQVLFILFFEDASKFSGLKITYICMEYFGSQNVGSSCNIINGILHNPWLLINIIGPWILAFLSIWFIPFLGNFILSQKLRFLEEQEQTLDRSNIDIVKSRKGRIIEEHRDEENQECGEYDENVAYIDRLIEEDQKKRETSLK